MRIIQKEISLEPMTSRLPSVWPAYKDNVLYFFDKQSLKKRKGQYPCNYGMIPMSLSASGETYSFTSVSSLYHFYRDYKHLLKLGHENKVYTSATEYYDTEIKTKYHNDLEYGVNREVYEEMDIKYQENSGICKFISESIVPTYEIPSAYTEYWKTDMLYYPDVIRWLAWFKEREPLYNKKAIYTAATSNQLERWNCKNSAVTDCCDCDDYFRRGGSGVTKSMKDWYDRVQNKILSATTNKTVEPDMICEVELQNSLDNLGVYTDLSPQYELGKDYRVASSITATMNTDGGTTAIVSGKTQILSSGQGFCFSPTYMEKIYDEDAWEDYTTIYINDNSSAFTANAYQYYAFDDENRMYTGITSGNVKTAMSSGDTYDVISTDSILIDNELVPIQNTEYGEYESGNTYLSGRTYFVYRDEKTQTPYTVINGKQIYADPYITTSGFCYYFSFFRTTLPSGSTPCNATTIPFNINDYKIFPYSGASDDNITYIALGDRTHVISTDSGVTIDGIDYARISGYAYDKYGNIMYTIYHDNTNNVYDADLNKLDKHKLSHNTILVDVYNDDIEIYQTKYLTGHTISKLADLAATNKLVDDTGNDINGLYDPPTDSNVTYIQPAAGTVLEPLYQVGNTSLIAKFKLTKEKESEMGTDTINYFVGNIITSMTFYYKDIYGDRTSASAECNDNVSSLSAITKADSLKNNTTIYDENLYCDIEYCIGATLQRKSGEPFKLAEDGNGKRFNHGVEYKETVRFVKTPTFYRLKIEPNDKDVMPTEKYEAINLPHKYVVYTYEMKQDMTVITNNVYNTAYEAPLAEFKTEINLIDGSLRPNFSAFTDMEDYDGINVSPVFKEEYKMGMAAKENVDSDIYIDRGINAAFERHLKLGEVTSMEAMLQYGNGFFKIMDS